MCICSGRSGCPTSNHFQQVKSVLGWACVGVGVCMCICLGPFSFPHLPYFQIFHHFCLMSSSNALARQATICAL